MILVDTSVWIDYFRNGNELLADRLNARLVLLHPFVFGELATGNLPRRTFTLARLSRLPHVVIASHAGVLHFIEQRGLVGRGLGYIDVHLLASASLTQGAHLWTRDRRLSLSAEMLGLIVI